MHFANELKRPDAVALAWCMAFAAALLLAGLTRGWDESGARFHGFHPDEDTVVRAALALDSPFVPPITNYGLLPLYILRVALELAGLADDPDLTSPEREYAVFMLARTLAALASWATVWLVFLLGRMYCSAKAAVLAALLVAAAPIAIQQGHFYTVDGLFATCNTAALVAMLRVLGSRARKDLWLCGLLIGLAISVRHIGLLLLPVLVCCYALNVNWRGSGRFRAVFALWPAILATCATVLVLQPYMLTSPGLLLRVRLGTDFYYAVKVARGELLRTWSLADYHTAPYLYHWTSLWPDGVGWPVAALLAAGLVYGVARANRQTLPLLLWAGIYFAAVGKLHTKHIRYLLPLLPVLALLAAVFIAALLRHRRIAVRGVLVALCGAAMLYGIAYGSAFASIYTREDSRITAGRWIERHVPPGSAICVESGAFNLRGVVDGSVYRLSAMRLNDFFDQQGYLTCGAAADELERRLAPCDYIAIADVNRLRPFTHVPDLFPATASCYRHLAEGHLGFDRVDRFKNYPTLFGVEFRDDDAEVSFLSFDHPAVFVLRRKNHPERDFSDWRRALALDEYCVDRELNALAADLDAGQYQRAIDRVPLVASQYPSTLLVHLMAAYAGDRAGERRPESLRAYRSGYSRQRFTHGIPGAAAMSFAKLGLGELSVLALADGLKLKDVRAVDYTPRRIEAMARSYLAVGDTLLAKGDSESARLAWAAAIRADPTIAPDIRDRLAPGQRADSDSP